MTDKYGSEPNEHEQEGMAGEHETWTSEPPVDDFHAGEEAAIVSEESEMPEEALTEQASPKKSLALPLVAGIGGLLFLAAVLYWQFGSSANAPLPVAQVPPLSTQTVATDMVVPPSSENTAPADLTKPATPTDVAPTTGLTPVTDATPKPMPLPTPAAAPTSDATVVALPPKPVADAAAPVVPVPVATTAPVAVMAVPVPVASAAKDNSLDARMNSLSARVEDLQKSLTQAVQQLSQVNATLAAPPANTAIDDRLTKIEQKLAQMQSGSRAVAARDTTMDMGTDITSPTMMTKFHKHATHAKKTAAFKSKKTSHATYKVMSRSTVKTPASFTHWVLRAATPDEAWVATNETSPELRHVQVGDSLAGVGVVQAIRQNGNSWIIQGSQGTIQ